MLLKTKTKTKKQFNAKCC